MTLALLGNNLLRTAITHNIVSFPAQIRPFVRRGSGDLQERMVQLYFVRGWPVRSICNRYGVSKAMVHKLLAEWRIRAVESGYIQEIETGALDGLLRQMSAQEPSAVNAPRVLVEAPKAAPELRDFVFAAAVSAPRAGLSAGGGV
jgi:transposase-like protein